jgi:uncharacterized protein (DUF934 family)
MIFNSYTGRGYSPASILRGRGFRIRLAAFGASAVLDDTGTGAVRAKDAIFKIEPPFLLG